MYVRNFEEYIQRKTFAKKNATTDSAKSKFKNMEKSIKAQKLIGTQTENQIIYSVLKFHYCNKTITVAI